MAAVLVFPVTDGLEIQGKERDGSASGCKRPARARRQYIHRKTSQGIVLGAEPGAGDFGKVQPVEAHLGTVHGQARIAAAIQNILKTVTVFAVESSQPFERGASRIIVADGIDKAFIRIRLMPGGVGAGGGKPPATRFGKAFCRA